MTAPIPVSRTGATDREVEADDELDSVLSYIKTRTTLDHLVDYASARGLLAARAAAAPDPRIDAVLALHRRVHTVKDLDRWLCESCTTVWPCPTVRALQAAALLAEQPGGARPRKLESGRCEICGYEVVRLGSTRWQHARSDLDTHQAVPR